MHPQVQGERTCSTMRRAECIGNELAGASREDGEIGQRWISQNRCKGYLPLVTRRLPTPSPTFAILPSSAGMHKIAMDACC